MERLLDAKGVTANGNRAAKPRKVRLSCDFSVTTDLVSVGAKVRIGIIPDMAIKQRVVVG